MSLSLLELAPGLVCLLSRQEQLYDCGGTMKMSSFCGENFIAWCIANYIATHTLTLYDYCHSCAGRVVRVWRRGSTGIAPSLRPHDVGDIQYSR